MQFHTILIVAALSARWGLVLIAAVVGAYALHRVVREFRASNPYATVAAEAEADRLDELRVRAHQQLQWVMQSDPRVRSAINNSLPQDDSSVVGQ